MALLPDLKKYIISVGTSKKNNIGLILVGIIVLALSVEVCRDAFTRAGDFAGYASVGNLVLEGKNAYQDPLVNTWPPFFSIVSVPIGLVDNLSKYLVRFLWLIGSIIAMFYVMNYTTKLTINRKISISPFQIGKVISNKEISLYHWIIVVPLLISFRYVLDNLSNIQINIFMLLFAITSIYLFSKNKDILAALILAFSISIKVYTVFLLLYFIIKRAYKMAGFTILFCILFSIIPFLVFGLERTVEYYTFWYKNTVEPFASGIHKNQSFFGMMRRLFLHEIPDIREPFNKAIYLNFINLSIGQIKIVSYGVIAVFGSVVLYLFRGKLIERNNLRTFIEYAFILNIVPLLSPLAWKAYFIFLFPSYFISYFLIFKQNSSFNNATYRILEGFFYASIILTVFSSELFIGKYLSCMMETYSLITIGSAIAAINLLILHVNSIKFEVRVE